MRALAHRSTTAWITKRHRRNTASAQRCVDKPHQDHTCCSNHSPQPATLCAEPACDIRQHLSSTRQVLHAAAVTYTKVDKHPVLHRLVAFGFCGFDMFLVTLHLSLFCLNSGMLRTYLVCHPHQPDFLHTQPDLHSSHQPIRLGLRAIQPTRTGQLYFGQAKSSLPHLRQSPGLKLFQGPNR